MQSFLFAAHLLTLIYHHVWILFKRKHVKFPEVNCSFRVGDQLKSIFSDRGEVNIFSLNTCNFELWFSERYPKYSRHGDGVYMQ